MLYHSLCIMLASSAVCYHCREICIDSEDTGEEVVYRPSLSEAGPSEMREHTRWDAVEYRHANIKGGVYTVA